MDKILGTIFLLTTILMGLISNGKIELDRPWPFVILIVQIVSWLGYTSLLDIDKRYKIGLIVLNICFICIVGFFYLR